MPNKLSLKYNNNYYYNKIIIIIILLLLLLLSFLVLLLLLLMFLLRSEVSRSESSNLHSNKFIIGRFSKSFFLLIKLK